jgi:Na+/H+-dicarboxylate symporter
MFSILRQRSVQTVLVLGLYICFAAYLPLLAHQSFYTVSLFIKDLLVWMMPVTVGFFIANTVAGFEKKAPLFIVTIVLFEALSNFSSVMYSYAWGHALVDRLPSIQSCAFDESFKALWRLPFVKPAWWGSDKGCIVGLVLGWLSAFARNSSLRSFLYIGKTIAQGILTQFFSRLIPLFILGFAAHMYYSGSLVHVFKNYGAIVLWLLLMTFIYITLVFAIGAGWRMGRMIQNIRHLLPAWSIALSSGCSLSTMPWTIKGSSKNLDDPHLAEAIIPATTNIQQIGDCIANSFLCFVIYTQFFGSPPPFQMWFNFTIIFVLARFATAAVLGGAIFIMLPIYEQYLNFTPDMIAIILALNVVLDPFVTSSNVLANGGLCRVFEKVWARVKHHNFYVKKTS